MYITIYIIYGRSAPHPLQLIAFTDENIIVIIIIIIT